MISLRPSLITAHHSVSSLNDPAREASPCSRYLRPARDVDTTCTVRRNVHESMATKVRAHRAPNLLRGCVGRSDRSAKPTLTLRSIRPSKHVTCPRERVQRPCVSIMAAGVRRDGLGIGNGQKATLIGDLSYR